jgi:type IV secretion system protein VirB6
MFRKLIDSFFTKPLRLLCFFISSLSSTSVFAESTFTTWLLNTILSFFVPFFIDPSCINPPDLQSMQSDSRSFFVGQVPNSTKVISGSGVWINTGAKVSIGQTLQINWTTDGINSNIRKYAALYRIDPRFSNPQLFILKYNYLTNSYDSDFHQYMNGKLLAYQAGTSVDSFNTKITNLNNYFNFVNRDKIAISAGEVVNISLTTIDTFLQYSPAFNAELGSTNGDLMIVNTRTNLPDNNVAYLGAETLCRGQSGTLPSYYCAMIGNDYIYNTSNYINRITGILDINGVGINATICPEGDVGPNFQDNNNQYIPCFFNGGILMPITINNSIIKPLYAPFTYSSISGKYFFNIESDSNGYIEFVDNNNQISNNNLFHNFNPLMSSWDANYGASTSAVQTYLEQSIAGRYNSESLNIYGGRYIMDITIGNGNGVSNAQRDGIKVEYMVLPDGSVAPSVNTAGVIASQSYVTAAFFTGPQSNDSTGVLWLRVLNDNSEVYGSINIAYSYYTGNTVISDILYHGIVEPIQELILNTAKQFYTALALNPTYQLLLRTILTLFIIYRALQFLAGNYKVTLDKLLSDVLRVIVLIAILSPGSWEYFYTNGFKIFSEGMGYLFKEVVGLTSNPDNPFGFMDIIFDKYTNEDLWVILFTEFIAVYHGLTVTAIMTVIAILSFLVLVIDIVVAYVFAYIVIVVLIGFAPLFVTLMLFERTRGIFDSWISVMFSYMIQPTILLMFFLLIDQLMTSQLISSLPSICMGVLVNYNLLLDIITFGQTNISIPGFGLHGYVPKVSSDLSFGPYVVHRVTYQSILMSTILLYLYTKIAQGLSVYVTKIIAILTGASVGAQERGKQVGGVTSGNLAEDIKSFGKGAAKEITSPLRSLKKDAEDQSKYGRVRSPQERAEAKKYKQDEEFSKLEQRFGKKNKKSSTADNN